MPGTSRRLASPETSLAHVFSPIRSLPTEQGDKTVTNTIAVLFNDATDTTGFGARRVRIYNPDASATLGIYFTLAGVAASGAITASCKIAAGTTLEFVISNGIRVSAISSAASQSANVLVHDV